MKVFSLILILLFAGDTFAQLYSGVHFTNFEQETSYPFNPCHRILYGNNYVNFVSPENIYSATYEAWKPAELTYKPFWLKTKINILSPNQNEYNLVISASLNDSAVYYQSKKIIVEATNKWFSISDSTLFPSNLEPEIKFKVFIWNHNKNDTLYIDDFYVYYNEFSLPDYLFDYSPPENNLKLSPAFKNEFYQLNIDTLQGTLFFSDVNSRPIINQPALQFQFKNKSDTLTITSSLFYFTGLKKLADTVEFAFFNSIKEAESEIFIKTIPNSPEVLFNYRVKFFTEKPLIRAALVLPYVDSAQTIIDPRGNIETTKTLLKQYWLGKHGGCIIGKNKRTLISLFNTNISSTQIDNYRKLLVFNFDYALDHPMLNMPLLEKELNYKTDVSATRTENLTLRGNFTVSLGKSYASIPIINLHYSTYQSTIIFTEHADWANTATHRAVYYGSSTIKKPKMATGGFVKYNLPVTKSVFYHNPYKSRLTEITNQDLLTTGYASVKENKEYFSFLIDLKNLGNEICLHTPEDKTTTQKWLEESLSFMRSKFGSSCWIDHGYDNSPASNRENLTCDGARENSNYFALDFWKKYNITNFWNPYFEDFPVDPNLHFYSSLIKPYFKIAQSVPTPILCIHPNFKSFNQFFTYSVTQAPDPSLWNYLFNEQRLYDFIRNRGTFIAHVYTPAIHNNYGFWQIKNRSVEITPEFNQVLERIANKRKQKLINVCTIENWINDVRSKEQLKYQFTSNGIYLFNSSSLPLVNVGIFYQDQPIANYNFEPGKAIKFSE